MKAPKYEVGKIYDLRFTKEHMPDRIYIKSIHTDDEQVTNGWMYGIYSEKDPWKLIWMNESDIDSRISKKDNKCYQHEIIKYMYSNGFRFCGNSKHNTAISRANKLKSARYIAHIVLRDAVDADGNILEDQLGLWVQYNRIFDDVGFHKDENGCYKIK